MSFQEAIKRLRRFLRDPESLIWSDEALRVMWNQAQIEISNKAGKLQTVKTHHWPPLWSITYLQDWEYRYCSGDFIYQAFAQWQANDSVLTYPWEAGHYLDSASALDDGARTTHPWEASYVAVGGPVPFPFPLDFDHAVYMAHDENNIEPRLERELAKDDPWYQTHSGQAEHYWRPDEIGNAGVLYPQPASSTWDDTYEDAWEDAAYSSADNLTAIVDPDTKLLLVYYQAPTDVSTDITTWDDTLQWPDWWCKYIVYATLERAFGADTEGYIPTLRDYWKQRKDLGIKHLQLYNRQRMADRDIRLGGEVRPLRPRHARLPWSYADRW